MLSPPRPIKRLAVVNRGEIAVRILHAARELPTQHPIETYALFTSDDYSHCHLGRPDHAIQLPSAAHYMNIPHLVQLVKDHSIDAVHPGYGFLSESAEFARRMWDEVGAMVIGPGWEALEQTGDKLRAKAVAEVCQVPVLMAMKTPTADVEEIRRFAREAAYPVMIKAVDGGGGRGIRLVETEDALQRAVDRATGESPSRKVFVEKAAVGGFHHIEIQIIGDGKGGVRHLWERDCSVQRRFQKIVEFAPARMPNRGLIGEVIESALRMARKIKYLSLGTWEFLVNEKASEFYFLEINPRLQVEHTVTEGISSTDLVQSQILLAQGLSFDEMGLAQNEPPQNPPPLHSIQLRICAEDPSSNFSLSIGKVTEFHFPSGNGIRIDTHMLTSPLVIGADFDNLMAKVIVTASNWERTIRKAQRALEDTRIVGVKTNIDILRGILASRDFESGSIDTHWLEASLGGILETGQGVSSSVESRGSLLPLPESSLSASSAISASNILFRKGDAWSIALEAIQNPGAKPVSASDTRGTQETHHLLLKRILRNEFPSSLSAEIEYTTPQTTASPASTALQRITLSSTNSGAGALSSVHRRGDPNNKSHIIVPMSGRLIEVLVSEGDVIEENEVIAFVKQMKMELEVRSPRSGRVTWALELEEDDGEEVAEGVLLAELEGGALVTEKPTGQLRGKL